jgi:hypothetical protein
MHPMSSLSWLRMKFCKLLPFTFGRGEIDFTTCKTPVRIKVTDVLAKNRAPKASILTRKVITGKNKISLAKRAAHRNGWETAKRLVYGKTVTKLYKTFLATYRPTGGVIRVVIVEEDHDWHPFFSTDPTATVVEIIEAFADRATIEQDFHDVKEVWGAGQQHVRNIWTNLRVYHMNLWIHTLVELWSWNRPHEKLCDRSLSPWDDAERRPSHADRRKALRQQIMEHELLNRRVGNSTRLCPAADTVAFGAVAAGHALQSV